jgi:hypothetical protein
MTALSTTDAERLKLAFQRCRDMEGTLNEQLRAYAEAGRDIFPAYGEAVDRLALLWHFCFSDFYEEPFTMGASQGWRAFEEIENGLPDGGHAGLGWRSYDSFFSVPLL